jgi:hypothetical protein
MVLDAHFLHVHRDAHWYLFKMVFLGQAVFLAWFWMLVFFILHSFALVASLWMLVIYTCTAMLTGTCSGLLDCLSSMVADAYILHMHSYV